MNTATESRVDLPPTRTLAELYEKQGLQKEAADVYRQLIERDPDDEALKENLARLERGPASDDEKGDRPDSESVLFRLEAWLRTIRQCKRQLSGDLPSVRLLYVSVAGGNMGAEDDSFASRPSAKGLQIDGDGGEGDGDLIVDHWRCTGAEAFTDRIYQASGSYDALIIECEDETACGDAVKQALLSLSIPIVEISPGSHQGSDRRPVGSTIASAVTAQLVGFGEKSYSIAVKAAADMVKDLENEGVEFADKKQA